ncbi:MAG: STAS domain-containing protein [Bacteroidales bacterium]|nr:MAG: STAS domain-containing protein [Bacteroidales bacterium]
MISIVYNDDYVVMSLGDLRRIDLLVIEKLKNHLLHVIENATADIYLDLKEVKFIDSNSFAGFKSASDIAVKNGINLYFVNVSKELMELFTLADENNDLNIRSESEVDHLRAVLA